MVGGAAALPPELPWGLIAIVLFPLNTYIDMPAAGWRAYMPMQRLGFPHPRLLLGPGDPRAFHPLRSSGAHGAGCCGVLFSLEQRHAEQTFPDWGK